MTEPCMERGCWVMAYQLLLGPLRPNASICEHGHDFRLDEMVPPWPDQVRAQAAHTDSADPPPAPAPVPDPAP